MRTFVTTVAAVCAAALCANAYAAAPKGVLKINYPYTGSSPVYNTVYSHIPLRCQQFWGPGHLYVICTVRVAKKAKSGGAA